MRRIEGRGPSQFFILMAVILMMLAVFLLFINENAFGDCPLPLERVVDTGQVGFSEPSEIALRYHEKWN